MSALLNVLLGLLGLGVLVGSASNREETEVEEETVEDPIEEPPAKDEVPSEEEEEEDVAGPVDDEFPDLPDRDYDIGWGGLNAQEQYMLELVNRARMDPEGEEDRTGEDVDSGVSTSPKQALAVDPILSRAAELHSDDMLDQDYFAHKNLDNESPTDRADDLGYDYGVWENISARWTSAESVSDQEGWVYASHWGLWESDGHQYGMLQASHTVVGIGIEWGEDWDYPSYTANTAMTATQNFANDHETYLTGVVIDDTDDDEFYDIGEGQGDVQITIWNDENTYATSTWDAGGYSVAVESGTYNVRFEGGDLDGVYETTVTVGDENEKLDVFEDTHAVAPLVAAQEVEDDNPVMALFLAADDAAEALEEAARVMDTEDEPQNDDFWAMF